MSFVVYLSLKQFVSLSPFLFRFEGKTNKSVERWPRLCTRGVRQWKTLTVIAIMTKKKRW